MEALKYGKVIIILPQRAQRENDFAGRKK